MPTDDRPHPSPHRPWLMVLAGRPGTGKTTLAKAVAAATGACYLRVDAVETALSRVRDDVTVEGYVVVHELACSNLVLGSDVVVDAVNPVPEARSGWAPTADRADARLVVIQTTLTDEEEHRRRVEDRTPDIPDHRVPTWHDVQQDGWVPWDVERDGPRTLVDTAHASAAFDQAMALVPDSSSAARAEERH